MSSHLQVEAAATEVAWAEAATEELWLSERPRWESRWSVPTSARQKSVPRMPTSTPVSANPERAAPQGVAWGSLKAPAAMFGQHGIIAHSAIDAGMTCRVLRAARSLMAAQLALQ